VYYILDLLTLVKIYVIHCITRGFKFPGLLCQVAGLLSPDVLKECTVCVFKCQGIHGGVHRLVDSPRWRQYLASKHWKSSTPEDQILDSSAVWPQMSQNGQHCSLDTLSYFIGVIESLRMWVVHVAWEVHTKS